MTIHGIVADVLLGLAAVVVLASSAGILVMRDAYQKLHYVTPIAVVAPVIVALAVLVQSGWTSRTAGRPGWGCCSCWPAGPSWPTPRSGPPGSGRRATGGPPGLAGTGRGPGRAAAPGSAMGSAHLAAVVTPYTIPAPLMDVLQVTLLVLVAAGATAVVLIREPVRQAIMLSLYGVLLAVLFLAFQAPDVTLSELTVGAVALPVLLLLTLAKVRRREK